MRAWLAIAAILLPPASAGAQSSDNFFNGEGYRIAHYRAPVHQPPRGVGRIAPSALRSLRPDVDVILVDVLPAEGGHREADGRWVLASDHASIPGAHWFPESGRGEPLPAIAAAFERGIARLTRGNRHRMIVTYCLSDCWMGWNAAKRLNGQGYDNVWWLAEGTDGWRELGLNLKPILPDH